MAEGALLEACAEIGAVVALSKALRGVTVRIVTPPPPVNLLPPTKLVVTPFFVAGCVGLFVVMAFSGVRIDDPTTVSLYRWGGNFGAGVAVDGQRWRLFTSMFLHGGLIHLLLNMWCLLSVGPLIERLYGRFAYATLYLAAGIGGALASGWWHPTVVGVGASGAIFGVIGGLLAFSLRHREAIASTNLAGMRSSMLLFVGYNLVPGFLSTRIDNAAHLGGLATGFLAGLLLCPAWPPGQTGRLAEYVVRVCARGDGARGRRHRR